MKKKSLFVILAIAFFISACGNKGDLYLPDSQDEQEQKDD